MKQAQYRFLPFRFKPLGKKILLTSEAGEYHALTQEEWQRLIEGQISPDEDVYFDLAAKDFVCRAYTPAVINRVAAKYRTKKKFLFESTALHMFVITHRCNQSCAYCHASSVESPQWSLQEDMSPNVARKCVESAFESPSPYLKFEFQGGEPTLNFEAIMAIVAHAKRINTFAQKRIEFVICTNLYKLKNSHLEFFHEHDIQISTSLDGPAAMHDSCRKTRDGSGTHATLTEALLRAKASLGSEKISALLTVTGHNVLFLKNVIDEYSEQGFSNIFIRRLNRLGAAQKCSKELDYSDETFLTAYLDALEYIIALNKDGRPFIEEFAAIMLGKILTPFSSGFVDMQSPAGTGISAVIYDVDGSVFVSDEARMLHRTTQNSMFCLGNVFESDRNALFATPILKDLMEASTLECLPGCAWCVYLPYCGSDPVRNFSLYGKLVSLKSEDSWCFFYKRVFDRLFEMLFSDDEETIDILWSWVTRRHSENSPRWDT